MGWKNNRVEIARARYARGCARLLTWVTIAVACWALVVFLVVGFLVTVRWLGERLLGW